MVSDSLRVAGSTAMRGTAPTSRAIGAVTAWYPSTVIPYGAGVRDMLHVGARCVRRCVQWHGLCNTATHIGGRCPVLLCRC
jgi:hypothetical protein